MVQASGENTSAFLPPQLPAHVPSVSHFHPSDVLGQLHHLTRSINAFHISYIISAIMAEAAGYEFPAYPVKWLTRDVLLFANSIGCTRDELQFIYVRPSNLFAETGTDDIARRNCTPTSTSSPPTPSSSPSSGATRKSSTSTPSRRKPAKACRACRSSTPGRRWMASDT